MTVSQRPLAPVIALVVGLAAIIVPTTTALVVVLLLGVYALGDGLINIVDEFSAAPTADRAARFTAALVSVALGAATLIWPGIAQPVIVVALGAAAIAAGGWQILAGLALRRSPAVAGNAALGVGTVLVALGAWVITHPGSGRTITIIGGTAVLCSLVVGVQAFRDRS